VNIFDIILVIILIVGAVGGYQKGFLYSLFSLLAILLGVLGGFKLMGMVMINLSLRYEIESRILPYVAFGVVFIVIVIFVRLLGSLLRLSLEKSIFGRADQAAGAVLGLVKTVFMLSVILWIADSLGLQVPGHWREDSGLYGFVANAAPKTAHWIGEVIPSFSNLFSRSSE